MKYNVIINVEKRQVFVIQWNTFSNLTIFLNKFWTQSTQRLKSIRDLGVIFSENFSWDFHIGDIVKKILQKVARMRWVEPAETKANCNCVLVESYLLSVINYGTNIWFPSKVRLQRLDKVQRRCVKWTCRKWNLSDSDYVLSLINQCLFHWVQAGPHISPSFEQNTLLDRLFWIHLISGRWNHTTWIQAPVAKSWFMLEKGDRIVANKNFVRVAKYNNALLFTHNLSWNTPLVNPILSKEKWQNSLRRKQYRNTDTTAILLDGIR